MYIGGRDRVTRDKLVRWDFTEVFTEVEVLNWKAVMVAINPLQLYNSGNSGPI